MKNLGESALGKFQIPNILERHIDVRDRSINQVLLHNGSDGDHKIRSEMTEGFDLPIEEFYIEVDELLKLIVKIGELNGSIFASSLHNNLMTGYVNKWEIQCDTYCIRYGHKILKLKFDGTQIPFNDYIVRREREKKINGIIGM